MCRIRLVAANTVARPFDALSAVAGYVRNISLLLSLAVSFHPTNPAIVESRSYCKTGGDVIISEG
eukprot:943931-Pyramimonas_sp.AAC.1